MLQIKTQRLDLVPLAYNELLLLASGRNTLERSMGLVLTDFQFNSPYDFAAMFQQAIQLHVIPAVKNHSRDFRWYTHWLMVDRAQQLTVGGIAASGLPNVHGEVMIGYFVERNAEGKGFATEAVKAFTRWVFDHPQARAVIADTLSDGWASQKVLQKSGFVPAGPCADGLRWKLARN